MRGVIFGSYNTATDWSLILNEKTITPPTPKTVYVSVDGRDGDLDLSEALTGDIKYQNRQASFTFLLTEGSVSERETLISTILGVVHGKKLNVYLPDDINHYLIARCSVSERKNKKAYGSIKIDCTCEPWLYAKFETIRTFTLSATPTNISLSNGGIKTVIPDITVTGSAIVAFDSSSVSLSDGNYKLTDLKIPTGSKVIRVSGSGSIVFTYREGVL